MDTLVETAPARRKAKAKVEIGRERVQHLPQGISPKGTLKAVTKARQIKVERKGSAKPLQENASSVDEDGTGLQIAESRRPTEWERRKTKPRRSVGTRLRGT
jgi:hypothetical protein